MDRGAKKPMERGETYVLDTIAYVSHLLGVLPEKARKVIEGGEHGDCRLLLPSISLGEAIYIFEKARKVRGRTADESLVWEMLDRLERGAQIKVEELDFVDWRRVADLPYRDLHDRMIVAKTLRHNAILVTNDKEITESSIVQTLW